MKGELMRRLRVGSRYQDDESETGLDKRLARRHGIYLLDYEWLYRSSTKGFSLLLCTLVGSFSLRPSSSLNTKPNLSRLTELWIKHCHI